MPDAERPAPPDGEALLSLARMKMPFGRYKGTVLLALPEPYLLWFQQKGFPHGSLGRLMALALEIKINGLEDLVDHALHQHRGGAALETVEREEP